MTKVCLAALGIKDTMQLAQKIGVEDVLISFFGLKDKDFKTNVLEKFPFVFLDSGGYSLRVSKKKISVPEYLKDYINFIKENNIQYYANVDMATTEETLRNQRIMEEAGLKPIPVYHWNEFRDGNRKLMDDYCEKYDYVAIGGVAKVVKSRKDATKYLNFCFKTAKKHKTKLHGFGITADIMLKRYNFYSVDSTSWMVGNKYGHVFYFANGKMKMYSKKNFFEKFNKFNHLKKNINEWNIIQWKNYTDYLKEFWKGRNYWERNNWEA
jgi:dimeric dUTPase (all-alpha-NTP-PPase superfamily)